MAAEQDSDSTEPAGSEALLDAVLRTLYDLGEPEGETEQKRIKKRVKKRDSEAIADAAAAPLPLPGSPVRCQKKSASNFFRELREELQSAPAAPSQIPSTSAVSLSPLKKGSKPVEVVEFQSKSKKRKPKPHEDEPAKNKTKALEKDVGIQEFNLEKPPKNDYVNYKVLQKQIKEKKTAAEEEKRAARETDIFKRKKRKGRGQEDRRSKKSAPSILSSGRAGQVGKFRNGTLILSPTDIKKINSSRVAK
ncbi:uncharacterized protein C1orf131 homolog isoform X2 [Apodemus sylvaticus]|uniref:uncharacterized protein C1orf131 homolog isoform X2 n=1 Tax=Apodemus sylvaticus TaxID=10129 RepID=UPI002243AC8A|nr:uncharacterized protein C1orf131 homolog isoform X2 [Apodemus sylvaticus]